MKIGRLCYMLGMCALCIAFAAPEATAMQQSQPLKDRGLKIKKSRRNAVRVMPERIQFLGPDGKPTSDWIDVTPEMTGQSENPLAGPAPDCTSMVPVYDAGEFDPSTGEPIGGNACHAGGGPPDPGLRYYFGPGVCALRWMDEYLVEPGTEGSIISRTSFGWDWFVDGVNPEECIIILLVYDNHDDTCAMSPNGFPADHLTGGVAIGFGPLDPSIGGYYYSDVNLCTDLGVDTMFRMPVDGEGAVEIIFANAINPDGTIQFATCAQPMQWGTEAGRAGTNTWIGSYVDIDPTADGVYDDECFDMSGAGAVCDGNTWDSDAFAAMITLWTLDAGNAIPPGLDLLQEDPLAASSLRFGGVDLPPIPADIFGPGSDPFSGVIPLVGQSLDPACSTIDSALVRSETAIIPTPGVAPDDVSQFIPIEMLALNLVSSSPITVTFLGGGGPQLWDVSVGLLDPQPANTAVLQDGGGGGVFSSSPFLFHPVMTFTRQSDLQQVVYDPGVDIPTSISAAWTATAPPMTPVGTEDNEFFFQNLLIFGTELVIQLQNAVQTTVPPNDDCVNAASILPGLTAFDTECASTDGPTNPAGFCFDGGETQTAHDLWYSYTAPLAGNDVMLLVSTCPTLGGSANYDSDLAMYDGTVCLPDTMFQVACNDDAVMYQCGLVDFLSAMYAPVTNGQDYLIRVGGFAPGDAGQGQLHVEEVPIGDGFISQDRDGVNSFASDQDAGQTMAENFRLSQAETVQKITIYGAYEGGDNQPIENFTVMFQADQFGLPGAVLDFQAIPPSNTTHTDVTPPLGGVSAVWKIDLVLPLAVNLPAGRFWVSVFNDTVGDADNFFWDTGSIDLPHAHRLGSIASQGGVPTTIEGDLALTLGGGCVNDTNGDFIIDVLDLLAVLGAWGPCDAPCPPNCAADVNEDCIVDVLDLLAVLGAWGACE